MIKRKALLISLGVSMLLTGCGSDGRSISDSGILLEEKVHEAIGTEDVVEIKKKDKYIPYSARPENQKEVKLNEIVRESNIRIIKDEEGFDLFEVMKASRGDILTKFLGSDVSDIVIPEGIVEIDGSAFGDYKSETLNKTFGSLTLPSTLKVIGDYAFYNRDLDEIILPEGLEKIGKGAFAKGLIKTITIPDSVTHIGTMAFGDNSLEEVIIGSGVKVMGDNNGEGNPFSGNRTLERFILSSENNNFDINEESIYSKDGKVLISTIKGVELREGVEKLADMSIYRMDVEDIVFPDSLRVIGELALSHNKLKDFMIPDTIEVINSLAFSQNRLEVLRVPSKLLDGQGLLYGSEKQGFNPHGGGHMYELTMLEVNPEKDDDKLVENEDGENDLDEIINESDDDYVTFVIPEDYESE